MNTIIEERSHDGMSSTSGTPVNTPTRGSPRYLLGDDEIPTSDSDGPPMESPFRDERDDSSSSAELMGPLPATASSNKNKKYHPYNHNNNQGARPEESPLQMPPVETSSGEDDVSTSTSENSEELDAALEKWADEIERSNRSMGTLEHDNRSTPKAGNAIPGIGASHLQWGHESLPAHLDLGEARVNSNLITYRLPQSSMGISGVGGGGSGHRPSHYYGYMDDPYKTNRFGDDDDDEYVCFGCIKREWSSSNPAMAVLVICIQIIVVIIFVMLFYPAHNSHSVTNSTTVPFMSEVNGGSISPIPTTTPFVDDTTTTPWPSPAATTSSTNAISSPTQTFTMAPAPAPTTTTTTTTAKPTPTMPTIVATTPKPTPVIATSKPTPVITTSKPTPVITTSKPTPVITTFMPTPVVTFPKPTPAMTDAPIPIPIVTSPPTTVPPTTVAPTEPTGPVGTTMFLQWLPQSTQETINSDFRSPQARAFDWMLQDPNWSAYNQERVLQRFALATLFFATNGEEWNQSNGWLDYQRHECDWGHVPTNGRLYDANTPICSTVPAAGSSPSNMLWDRSYQSIQLANNNLQGTIPPELQLLTNLRILDLSQNTNLSGDLPEAVFEECLRLQLVLVFENRLVGTIPTSVATLPNFVGFHAWDNALTGPIFPNNLLRTATNLRHWHVGNNRLTGTFPSLSLSSFPQQSPPSVESLWLYGNQMTGSLSPSIGDYSQLTSLLAWENDLSGTLPTQVGRLTQLQQLDLEENRLEGSIPTQLGSLSSQLKGLWLSSNNFTSTIPVEISVLSGLTILSLHSNALTGPIPEEIGLLTSLIDASMYGNQLTGEIPQQVGDMRSLRTLDLVNNQLVGPLPDQLGSLSNLSKLHLSQNQLTGPIPAILGNLLALQDLSLDQNALTGQIPAQLGRLIRLEGLSLDQNSLTGPIPPELGLLSANLAILDLSDNQLTSTIPIELGRLMGNPGGRLEQLRLFRNQLTGSIPDELFPVDPNSASSLVQFAAEENILTGSIPPSIGRSTNLREIRFSDNQLQGVLPSQIALLPLVSLELKGNQLTGSIPTEIGNLRQRLLKLDLEGNILTSSIPTQIGDLLLLSSLSLSSNNLWWTIPTEIGRLSRSLQYLHLAKNTFAGWMPTEIGELTKLEELHLDDNFYMFGPIPSQELSRLSNLEELTLNGTAFTGSLPDEVCDISVLHVDCAVGGNLRTGLCGCECNC